MFEGWDGAGKGDCVRKVTERLEPRGYRVHYVTRKPRTYERYLPWMWRFWLRLPNDGEMALFDMSWYGRVLVERVEKLTPKREWRKAYRDITEFERMLADDGAVIVKFWLHITKKEQRKRFRFTHEVEKRRENTRGEQQDANQQDGGHVFADHQLEHSDR